ncbi:MAG: sulfite exporter TauE/SafE family protein [Firmicutes bacterium]|nr:sulfite exporter TauE/SafE family protein [Bacillota bacterium]
MLYSSVGQGGASGYLAAMALLGVEPAAMKSTGLMLNVLVSAIATVRYYRAKNFSWQVFLPITLSSIPFAFIGGALSLPNQVYKIIAGIILLFCSCLLFFNKKETDECPSTMLIPFAILAGVLIGFLSGIVGVGGGIFLAPLLIFTGWANTREILGLSAAFVLANSISGLLGNLTSVTLLPNYVPVLAVAAILGGLIGTSIGINRATTLTIRRILAVVLVIAAVKLLLG